MTRPNILLVDDRLRELTRMLSLLRERLPGYDIHTCGSEAEFLKRLGDLASQPPVLVVTEVLVRWGGPAPSPPGFTMFKAGFRLADMCHGEMPDTRVIFYTGLGRNEDPEEFASRSPWAVHVRTDRDHARLLMAISEHLGIEIPGITPAATEGERTPDGGAPP